MYIYTLVFVSELRKKLFWKCFERVLLFKGKLYKDEEWVSRKEFF